MKTQITLTLDQTILQMARQYAQANQVSLSYLVENYLQKIGEDIPELPENKNSIVYQLRGIIQLPIEEDYRKSHADHLIDKRRSECTHPTEQRSK